MDYEHISVERADGIATIFLGRPEEQFATDAMLHELAAAALSVASDDEVALLILTGSVEDVFIQHHDISEIIALSRELQDSEDDFTANGRFPRMAVDAAYDLISNLTKPTIAAINGHCMGGGLELALCCDIRIGRRGPFQLGLIEAQFDCLPGGGGLTRLTKSIGYSRAIGPLLLGSALDTERAHALGILQLVADDPLTEAKSIGRRIAARSHRAIRHIKALAVAAVEQPLAESVHESRRRLFDLWSRPEALDRIEAFAAGEWSLDLTPSL